MNKIFTKKELVDALAKFKDDDSVIIEVHDTIVPEDLYRFYIDPIPLNPNGDTEIRLSLVPNIEEEFAPQVSVVVDGGIVQAVVSAIPLKLQIIDYDVEGAQDNELSLVPQYDGSKLKGFEEAYAYEGGTLEVDPVAVYQLQSETKSKILKDE